MPEVNFSNFTFLHIFFSLLHFKDTRRITEATTVIYRYPYFDEVCFSYFTYNAKGLVAMRYKSNFLHLQVGGTMPADVVI